jgi:hypothetical protein
MQLREVRRLLSNIKKAVVDLDEDVRDLDWMNVYMQVYGSIYDTSLRAAVEKMAEVLREAEGFER